MKNLVTIAVLLVVAIVIYNLFTFIPVSSECYEIELAFERTIPDVSVNDSDESIREQLKKVLVGLDNKNVDVNDVEIGRSFDKVSFSYDYTYVLGIPYTPLGATITRKLSR